MQQYIFKRLLLAIPTLIGVSMIVFVMLRVLPGDLVQHPSFGLGVATANKDGSKIEVLFEEGPKVLVHCR